jgi:hypothetical protein
MDMVTLIRVFNPTEADLMASRLRAAGVPVYLHSEHSAMTVDGWSMAAGGIGIQVPEEWATAAQSSQAGASPDSGLIGGLSTACP